MATQSCARYGDVMAAWTCSEDPSGFLDDYGLAVTLQDAADALNGFLGRRMHALELVVVAAQGPLVGAQLVVGQDLDRVHVVHGRNEAAQQMG